MTPEQLAALHAESFTIPRPWSAAEFADLLESPGSFLLTRPYAFLLGRVVKDEAELLTLAVSPVARRLGLARALVSQFLSVSRLKGAESQYLEVAANNFAALSLYKSLNWREAGRRPRYYGPGLDAIIMKGPAAKVAKSSELH